MTILDEQRYRIALTKAKRPPVSGFTMVGIFMGGALVGHLTVGLVVGMLVGGVVCAAIHRRNCRVVRRRLETLRRSHR